MTPSPKPATEPATSVREACAQMAEERANICNMLANDNIDRKENIILRDGFNELARAIRSALASDASPSGEAVTHLRWFPERGDYAVCEAGQFGAFPVYRATPPAPAAPAEMVEAIAKIVYAAMKWGAERAENGRPPEWVDRGNSTAQVEARRFASDIAALSPKGV
ncbi:hypothetical protein [Bosea sp. BK604]|uniref:hypothetical protein n=1 Tax=Bosea sp. BK604 TaxID=2512180 RepID=UPI00104F7F43|nr:hypothetical protein [Bosea sp. BK604]TCR64656.1 hypothetical protein EV560_106121 [Bosea sp. BK604]